mmetsp:Transcript_22798/g.36669  ORF Transcript_22798/g.36669 Transcript_22798/m.36669 type:complete len:410 (+) Transcript_22798:153-1382(+)
MFGLTAAASASPLRTLRRWPSTSSTRPAGHHCHVAAAVPPEKGARVEDQTVSAPLTQSIRSSAHGTPAWREFALAATGDWGGCCVEFDADGIALDVPLRYVHGVGRVPAAAMPFRDTVTDWMTKCEVTNTGDGVMIETKRALPEIGNEDAIASCGGSEWNEYVAYVEDEPRFVLRGAQEDKTVTSEGTFSAGPRILGALNQGDDPKQLPDNTSTVVQHCLTDPSSGRRVRVVHRVAPAPGDGGRGRWKTEGLEVWIEQKKACVAPFANDVRVIFDGEGGDGVGGKEWKLVPERSAAFELVWSDTLGLEEKDGGSTFVALPEASGPTCQGPGAVGPTVGIGGAGGHLTRLPCGIWVFCGTVAASSDSEESDLVVLEAGWITPSSERLFATRRYDARTGRLLKVHLGCERR